MLRGGGTWWCAWHGLMAGRPSMSHGRAKEIIKIKLDKAIDLCHEHDNNDENENE